MLKELYKTNEYGITYQDPEARLEKEVVDYYVQEHGIRADVHRTCINCQIRQIDNYKENKIKCSYIPKGLPAGSASKIQEIVEKTEMTEGHARKLLLAAYDPVAWCEIMFGFSDEDEKWFLRSYQKEQLRCTSKRISIREGRRSGKSFAMALKLLYVAFNDLISKGRDSQGMPVLVGPSIMVITPYQAQLTAIFEEMEKLVKRNISLKKEVTSGTGDSLYVKTPTFKMEFSNGGIIQGFVSGIGLRSDGSGGGTMRGQSADLVYMDEMDMIPEDILDKVIAPILATTPDTKLIATSTPIGKRGKFYEWCLERSDFKADYLPSSVIPHWESIKEEILRDSTEHGFLTEYMAVFVDDKDGLFKRHWVKASQQDYSYDKTQVPGYVEDKLGFKKSNRRVTCIGIDWNKNAGTEFYVIGFYPSENKWVALDAINVASSEFSAKRWMRELVELNYKWSADYIYADEGYGHTIIEDLKYYSYQLRGKPNRDKVEEAALNIADILVSFNFSSNVVLKDPMTNKDIKKLGKNFLVENAVRIIQEGHFYFPIEDTVLESQFFNYKILKRNSATNKPVYGKVNDDIGDHRLDAFMLALGGIVLEESVYSGKQLMPSKPTFHKEVFSKQENLNKDSEAELLINKAKEQGFPGTLSLLEISRQNTRKQQAVEKKSRDFYNNQNKQPSILEGMQKYLGTANSSKPIGSINNRKNKRSWK